MEENKEFELLKSAANFIRDDIEKVNLKWNGSPFEWILHLSPGAKGKLGKLLIIQWCALKGLFIDRSPNSESDFLLNGYRIEVKFSSQWANGEYVFQQIRDQDFDYCVCLGLSPFEAHCWVISKEILKKIVIGHMGQHTGSLGKETAWFTVKPNKIPEWLNGCGGSLDDAYIMLKRLGLKNDFELVKNG